MHSGHCLLHNDDNYYNLILWESKFGRRNHGRQSYSYIDNLKEDTDIKDIYEIRKVIIDRGRLRGEIERKFAKSKVSMIQVQVEFNLRSIVYTNMLKPFS